MDTLIRHIQHGHWSTDIEKLDNGMFRVTTSSGLRETSPQAFVESLEAANRVAGDQINEVQKLA